MENLLVGGKVLEDFQLHIFHEDKNKENQMCDKETKKINYLDIEEFVEKGYLQEVNRLFFHPLCLALEIIADVGKPGEVTIHGKGKYRLSGIWDYRTDEEGLIFDLKPSDKERLDRFRRNEIYISNQFEKFRESRSKLFDGTNIEPIPTESVEETKQKIFEDCND